MTDHAPQFEFTGTLWQYSGQAAWFFVTLPPEFAAVIKQMDIAPKRGFGSLRVQAYVGVSVWLTSIFPDSKSGSYVLPIKKEVRTKNQLLADADVRVKLLLRDIA